MYHQITNAVWSGVLNYTGGKDFAVWGKKLKIEVVVDLVDSVMRIYVTLIIFQSNHNLEAGGTQSLNIQVVRRGIEPWTYCSASQEFNNSTTAAAVAVVGIKVLFNKWNRGFWQSNKHIYILTPPQGPMMLMKCGKPLHELIIQVCLLYCHLNLR